MLHYVDGFSCSYNQSSGSLVLQFTQKEPMVQDDGEINIIVNPVTSIIMEKDCACGLLDFLEDIYKNKAAELENNSVE